MNNLLYPHTFRISSLFFSARERGLKIMSNGLKSAASSVFELDDQLLKRQTWDLIAKVATIAGRICHHLPYSLLQGALEHNSALINAILLDDLAVMEHVELLSRILTCKHHMMGRGSGTPLCIWHMKSEPNKKATKKKPLGHRTGEHHDRFLSTRVLTLRTRGAI